MGGSLSVPVSKIYASRHLEDPTKADENTRGTGGKNPAKKSPGDCRGTRWCNWLGFTMSRVPLYKGIQRKAVLLSDSRKSGIAARRTGRQTLPDSPVRHTEGKDRYPWRSA
ncbi:hypothetical protein GCM10010273_66210 [Streptomyces lavendulocolor]